MKKTLKRTKIKKLKVGDIFRYPNIEDSLYIYLLPSGDLDLVFNLDGSVRVYNMELDQLETLTGDEKVYKVI